VVAAWSVVSKDVAPYTVVAGAPARPVRKRFSEETIDSLLRIRWWDWEEEVVLERIDDLTSADLDAFTRKYDPAS
jgi:virginiamycin A acetyltransferase